MRLQKSVPKNKLNISISYRAMRQVQSQLVPPFLIKTKFTKMVWSRFLSLFS